MRLLDSLSLELLLDLYYTHCAAKRINYHAKIGRQFPEWSVSHR